MRIRFYSLVVVATIVAVLPGAIHAETVPVTALFRGEKTTWHGFDRYDFLMDQDQNIKAAVATPEEGDGYKHRDGEQRRCIMVVPKVTAPGNPWSWRGCYWDHQPQTEIELLKRGFCIGYIESNEKLRPDKFWDAWYNFLTEKHGLSAKPAFIGMSRGGEFAYTWAVRNPDKVSCLYVDNPGGNWEVLMNLAKLATNDVPVLHVCGSIDPLLGRFTLPIEGIYHQFGGRISVMIKDGRGHHPHSLRDPKPIADFIEQGVKEGTATLPGFVGDKFSKTSYYDTASRYQSLPSEQTDVTVRGPLFTKCYERYQIEIKGVEAFTTVIVPRTPAPGNPWMFRADFVDRDDTVCHALLAKGFYIVTGAVPYNSDGPVVAQWNLLYQHLIGHGFSKKPVMAGAGGAAGEAYAWAIENADKVSCIYAENPIMRSNTAKTQPPDQLEPLAKAGIPVLHVCNSDAPGLENNTLAGQKQYQQLGGKMAVLIEKGNGHPPLVIQDPNAVVDFITKAVR